MFQFLFNRNKVTPTPTPVNPVNHVSVDDLIKGILDDGSTTNCRNALTGLGYIHTLAFFQVPVKIKPIDLFYKLSSHASSFYLDASSSKPLFSPRKRQKKSKTPLLDLLHCTRLGGGVRLL